MAPIISCGLEVGAAGRGRGRRTLTRGLGREKIEKEKEDGRRLRRRREEWVNYSCQLERLTCIRE